MNVSLPQKKHRNSLDSALLTRSWTLKLKLSQHPKQSLRVDITSNGHSMKNRTPKSCIVIVQHIKQVHPRIINQQTLLHTVHIGMFDEEQVTNSGGIQQPNARHLVIIVVESIQFNSQWLVLMFPKISLILCVLGGMISAGCVSLDDGLIIEVVPL